MLPSARAAKARAAARAKARAGVARVAASAVAAPWTVRVAATPLPSSRTPSKRLHQRAHVLKPTLLSTKLRFSKKNVGH